jgi:hypothetical protein
MGGQLNIIQLLSNSIRAQILNTKDLEKTQLRFYSHNAHSWLNSDWLGEDGHHNSPGTDERQSVRKNLSGVDKK